MIWLELNLWWEAREKSKPDDGRKFALFVNTLPDFDPIYQSWRLPSDPPREALHLPMSEAEAKQLLKEHIPRNASGKVFWMLGSSIWGMHAGPPPYDLRRSSDAATLCSIGAYSYRNSPLPNHIRMSLTPKRPSTGHPWRASELRPLMKFAREVWNPGKVCAILLFLARSPGNPDPTRAAGQANPEAMHRLDHLPAAGPRFPREISRGRRSRNPRRRRGAGHIVRGAVREDRRRGHGAPARARGRAASDPELRAWLGFERVQEQNSWPQLRRPHTPPAA